MHSVTDQDMETIHFYQFPGFYSRLIEINTSMSTENLLVGISQQFHFYKFINSPDFKMWTSIQIKSVLISYSILYIKFDNNHTIKILNHGHHHRALSC